MPWKTAQRRIDAIIDRNREAAGLDVRGGTVSGGTPVSSQPRISAPPVSTPLPVPIPRVSGGSTVRAPTSGRLPTGGGYSIPGTFPTGGGGFPTFRSGSNPLDPIIGRGQDYCEEIGVPAWLCQAGGDLLGGLFRGGGDSSSPLAAPRSCPDGWQWNPDSQECETVGIRGGIERTLPGGRSGTLADVQGEPVVGAFGMPGVLPAQVGARMDARGEMRPILQCPTGMVLGRDDVCYMRSSLPRKYRKWPPKRKPPVSAADARAIRQADSAKNRVKKLAQKSGFSCKKR